MKKILMAAILCCAMTTTMMAEPVSPETARQAAAKFLNKKGVSLKSEAMRAKNRAMGHSDSGEQTEASPYYVFNATASQGFVVVSGDDCVGGNLVLGYTSQGSFDAEAIPDNLQWWLDVTANQISTLSRLGVKARTVALHNDVAPMVTARWDQGFPYNAFCPMTDGKQCITGCMATALSQVMYYHRWPQGPIAEELPAYTMANGRVIDGLPVTSFDWDNMVDDYTKNTTEAQQVAVATLMRYCGQVIQMDYTPQLSNGYFYDLDLIVNSFGYDPGVYLARADEYTVSGWDELIYNELREGRPMVYIGQSTGGGHAFVIDGYEVRDGAGYYDVNWGWTGRGNGFFRINLLNPDTSGSGGSTTKDGYNYKQAALIGLQPQKGSSEGNYRYLSSVMWDAADGDIEHAFVMINSSYRPGTFTVALAERNDDGTPDLDRISNSKDYDFTSYSSANIATGENCGTLVLPLTSDLFGNLTPGRHKLMFVNREAGTSASWRPVFGPSSYIEVNIGETGEVTETIIHPMQPQLAAAASDIKIEGLKQWGIAQNVTATIQNTGTEDFIGSVECGIYYVEDGVLKVLKRVFQTGLMVEAGGTSDIFYGLSVPHAGEFVFLLTKGGDGKDISGSKVADITQAPGYIGHKSVTFDILNFYLLDMQYAERNDDQGNPAYYLDLIIANDTPMDYDAVVLAEFYKLNAGGGYDPVVFPAQPNIYENFQLGSNMRKDLSIRLAEALEPGEYGINLLIANDFHSRIPNDYFVFAAGPLTVTPPTSIRSIDDGQFTMDNEAGAWYDLNGRRLSGKPTAKGLYIVNGRKVVIK